MRQHCYESEEGTVPCPGHHYFDRGTRYAQAFGVYLQPMTGDAQWRQYLTSHTEGCY